MKMYKGFFNKLMLAAGILIAAVLWLLSEVLPNQFGFFNFKWAVAIVCGLTGIGYLLGGIFEKKSSSSKTGDLIWGAILLVIGLISAGFAFPKKIIWPIIAVIAALSIFISVFTTRGKKWDSGDNQKDGYKPYSERKDEDEDEDEDEENDEDDR